jgi:hypothetical protein
MLDKIDVGRIITDHIDTLRDFRTGRRKKGDFVLFFILPLVAGAFAVLFVDAAKATGILLTSLSVFAALLFNLLLLVYESIQRARSEPSPDRLKIRILREVYANISFCIIVAVLAIVLLLAGPLRARLSSIAQVLVFLIYYLVGVFILTLLMVLKRVHILFSHEFDSSR